MEMRYLRRVLGITILNQKKNINIKEELEACTIVINSDDQLIIIKWIVNYRPSTYGIKKYNIEILGGEVPRRGKNRIVDLASAFLVLLIISTLYFLDTNIKTNE